MTTIWIQLIFLSDVPIICIMYMNETRSLLVNYAEICYFIKIFSVSTYQCPCRVYDTKIFSMLINHQMKCLYFSFLFFYFLKIVIEMVQVRRLVRNWRTQCQGTSFYAQSLLLSDLPRQHVAIDSAIFHSKILFTINAKVIEVVTDWISISHWILLRDKILCILWKGKVKW